MNMINTNSGFSLVELIIVVAIIGLLAAVGIPQYSKFRAKAHEVEAKASLSALYTSLRSFQGSFGFYHTSLQALGFSVSGKIYYNVGFGTPTAVVPSDFGYLTAVSAVSNTKGQCVGANSTGTDTSCRFQFDVPDSPLEATTSDTLFIAAAVSTPSLYAELDAPRSGLEMIAAQALGAYTAEALVTNPIVLHCGPTTSLCADMAPDQFNVLPTTRVWTINENKVFKTKQ